MPHRLRVPLALLVLTGCGSSTGPGGDIPPILTELPRTLSPSELRIVEGANAFAFELLREATKALPPDSNAFLSPLSASMALGMALNGANGETYDAMRTALRLDGMAEAEINQGYRDLTALLAGLDSRAEMRIANSIWGHSALSIEPAFTTGCTSRGWIRRRSSKSTRKEPRRRRRRRWGSAARRCPSQ
jgi:serpin B